MSNSNHILSKGQVIDDKFTVTFFLKKGDYAESYRVKDKKGVTKLLKLFSYSKLHRTQFDQNGDVLEIEILKKLKHPNIVKFEDSGCLLYTSDAADERSSVDLGGRRIIKKKKNSNIGRCLNITKKKIIQKAIDE